MPHGDPMLHRCRPIAARSCAALRSCRAGVHGAADRHERGTGMERIPPGDDDVAVPDWEVSQRRRRRRRLTATVIAAVLVVLAVMCCLISPPTQAPGCKYRGARGECR